MNDIKVSIVTPSFNQAHFLEETILSILNQTYKNIEYIIIDGGSTDGSINIIKKYDSKIHYWISEPDKGQTDAVNKGLEHCTGELVAYLNSDDIYELDAVEKVVEAFLKNKTAAVYYGKCSVIDEKGNEVLKHKGYQIDYNHLLNHSMVPGIFQPACFFNNTLQLRKPLFAEKFVIDYELLIWLLSKNYKFIFIDENIAKYRVHKAARTTVETSIIYEEKLRLQLRYGAGMGVKWKMLKFQIKKFLGLVK